ncbi:MAG TPA: protein translocase subunit SecD [Candidatus Pullilachnospira stercoravium]|uniref:Multifunctional fusion protein n=1 Tax=Candidatus Pullilachnospira stercoravium TaxID=2840913 RepID=A0A9D1NVR0_9FIRM|nr:protein translocase subunit SecD [Candidatus Pullilachnospira stercoravium]
MKKNQGILVLILTAVLIGLLAFTSAVGFGKTGTGSAKNIKTGLDLSGGVSITYQAVGDDISQEDMADTVYKLQQRVDSYSEESQVFQEGTDRITVEIPGVSDANQILEELGQPGSLEFQDEEGNVVLEGTDVETAEGGAIQNQTTGATEYVVELTLTDEGAEKFATATEENLNKQIAIVYDGETISAPTVNNVISNGQAQISGMSSIDEARQLASSIRIGALSVELEELSSNVVGAQLGQAAITTSLIAGGIGIALVAVFMIVVYALPGVAAALALIIYVGLELVMLNAFDLTLTLPGIAGIILSIVMAVDANVIIYARIREEIGEGRSVRTAIKTGFQKALSAILDGNITTLIAAAVLWLMGTGSVKGFAMTLALGIVLSMFTALVISRLIVNAFYDIGLRDEKFYGRQKERKTIHFVKRRKIFFTVSIILVLLGPAGMAAFQATQGEPLNFSLEFRGGTSTTVTFDEDYSIEEIDRQIKPVIQDVTGDAEIQASKVAGSNQVNFRTRALDVNEREELDQALRDHFGVEGDITAQNISSTVSSEMRRDALVAVAIATVCMLLYIWLRFKDVRFASSAVLALVHDVLVVFAFYVLSRTSVGNTFIACMLTIVGYSINATIVIFDRIRENMRSMKKNQDLAEIVDMSITQTLTRSIYTSLTTFITIFVLFLLGVASIREFAMPIMVGIVCGAYSSVCVTGPLWYVMKTKLGGKKEKNA